MKRKFIYIIQSAEFMNECAFTDKRKAEKYCKERNKKSTLVEGDDGYFSFYSLELNPKKLTQ
jgi:hypothetical protein